MGSKAEKPEQEGEPLQIGAGSLRLWEGSAPMVPCPDLSSSLAFSGGSGELRPGPNFWIVPMGWRKGQRFAPPLEVALAGLETMAPP